MKIAPAGFVWREVEVADEHGVLTKVMAMVPIPRSHNVCRRQFNPGDEYTLVPHESRSKESHGFFMACVNEAFLQLPEKIADRFPSADHLRAWCLIETGWFDEKEFDFDNKRDAHRLGTFIRTEDDFARISIHQLAKNKWKVLVRRAKSQSYASMNKQAFEASKKAVLDLLEGWTGVARGTLRKETGRHA